jgi:1,4-dihydroxy-2-naphthoate octaprenyltransferase
MTPWQTWLLAARPKTLPAAAAPVLVGTAVALSEGKFRPGPALAALAAALLIQIGTNLANDVFDYQKGADTSDRLGPLRVTQAGLLSPRQVLTGMGLVFALAVLLGLYLVSVGGWPIVAIGLLSILAGIAYTGGPFPLGYNGLGDLFVFIFFGLVAVGGTYYVQAGTVSLAAWWASLPLGWLATAILVVNNLRDIDTDRAVGKRTLAVRFGARGAQVEYLLLLLLTYLAPPLMWLSGAATPWVMLAWLSIPLAATQLRLIFTTSGRALNQALAGTARLELVFGLLFSMGLMAARFF